MVFTEAMTGSVNTEVAEIVVFPSPLPSTVTVAGPEPLLSKISFEPAVPVEIVVFAAGFESFVDKRAPIVKPAAPESTVIVRVAAGLGKTTEAPIEFGTVAGSQFVEVAQLAAPAVQVCACDDDAEQYISNAVAPIESALGIPTRRREDVIGESPYAVDKRARREVLFFIIWGGLPTPGKRQLLERRDGASERELLCQVERVAYSNYCSAPHS
jgi:hypothetical protein